MNNTQISSIPTTLLFSLVAILTLQNTAHGQGSLVPPGSPGPTMKTLAEVKPGTPINGLPFTITQPGYYYLTTNLNFSGLGITVGTSDVTIDLGGFTLDATNSIYPGVLVSTPCTNITVCNGAIRHSRSSGIGMYPATGARIHRITSSDNGDVGIIVGNNSLVTECQAERNGSVGIDVADGSTVQDCVAACCTHGIFAGGAALVEGCTAVNNTNIGIKVCHETIIRHCQAKNNGGNGISCGSAAIVENSISQGNSTGFSGVYSKASFTECIASGNENIGFDMSEYSRATRCTATGNLDGFRVGRASLIEQCTAACNNLAGIRLYGGYSTARANIVESNNVNHATCSGLLVASHGNVIEANNCANNYYAAVYVLTGYTNNTVIRNIMQGTGIVGNSSLNDIGPVGKAATATSPWANLQK